MSFRISKEHGINPSIDTCFICGKETNIVLFGTSYKNEDGETSKAPTKTCTGDICDNCKKIIDEGGIFFIAVKDGESGNNPWRTGQIGALKEEAVQKMFPGFPYKKINYIEETAYKQIFESQTI